LEKIENGTAEIYGDDYADHILRLALDVGEGMLRNGGEVSRVEDTIERICRAYGAAHVEVFTIISVINAAIRMPDGSYSSQMRRIRGTENDMYRLELYNEISRDICREKPPLEEFDEKIQTAKRKRAYPRWTVVPASAVAAGAFAVFFGGGALECVLAMFIGTIISLVELFSNGRVNGLANTVISSFLAGFLSFLSAIIVHGADSGIIMIGTIMLLVPGISFGTALRDLLCGDLLSGLLKTVQSVLAALMIAFGYMLSMVVMGGTWI
jgi:uncharacterized membrane protein YjjP (DUF1212 family)